MKRINTFIGSPVERVEDLRYLRGRGQYVDDLARPGQWHAAIVRSPVAHGRLRAIDTTAAGARPGGAPVIPPPELDPALSKNPFPPPRATSSPSSPPLPAAG